MIFVTNLKKGKMRLCYLLLFGILVGCGTNESTEGIKLSGSIENFSNQSFVHLERVTENGAVKTDTLEIDGNGQFSEYVIIPEPSFYRVNFNDRQIVSVILTGEEEEVTVNAHGDDPRGFSEVSGSYDTDYKNQMEEIIKEYQAKRSQFQQQQIAARNAQDYQAFNDAATNMMSLGVRTEKEIKELIWESTPSLAAIYGIQLIDPNSNYTFLDSVATELVAEMPDYVYVRNLVSSLEAKSALTIGSQAPEISLPNPDGEMISLSSLRGNYVLIDFWAAWCRPCRAENPNVVRVYNEYSDENFEILGVSLDKTKTAWTRAIAQDGLPWLHVSDLKFWRSEAAQTYQVNAIPATYLIDPDGKIIAKNLRGASLEAKLKEIFG